MTTELVTIGIATLTISARRTQPSTGTLERTGTSQVRIIGGSCASRAGAPLAAQILEIPNLCNGKTVSSRAAADPLLLGSR